MPRVNVSLPDDALAWIEEQVRSGRFRDADECLSALIRRDRERTAKIAEMQKLVDEGLASGAPESFDLDTFLKRMRQRHGETG